MARQLDILRRLIQLAEERLNAAADETEYKHWKIEHAKLIQRIIELERKRTKNE